MRIAFLVFAALPACIALACDRFGAVDAPGDDADIAEGGAEAGPPDASAAPDVRVEASCWTRPFGVPVNVPELSSTALELDVRLSPDERTAFLATNRDGGPGGVDVYSSRRASSTAPFDTPVPVAGLNTASDDTHATLAFDGLALYFGSTRPAPDAGAHRAAPAAAFDAPVDVAELNTASADRPSWISADGCRMYLTSTRAGGAGDLDVWRAER